MARISALITVWGFCSSRDNRRMLRFWRGIHTRDSSTGLSRCTEQYTANSRGFQESCAQALMLGFQGLPRFRAPKKERDASLFSASRPRSFALSSWGSSLTSRLWNVAHRFYPQAATRAHACKPSHIQTHTHVRVRTRERRADARRGGNFFIHLWRHAHRESRKKKKKKERVLRGWKPGRGGASREGPTQR